MLRSRLSILAVFLSVSVAAQAKVQQGFTAVPLTPEQAALVQKSVARARYSPAAISSSHAKA
jgi:hypothetical protein